MMAIYQMGTMCYLSLLVYLNDSLTVVLAMQPRSDAVKQLWIKAIKKMIVESIPEISCRIPPNLKDLLLKGARKAGV